MMIMDNYDKDKFWKEKDKDNEDKKIMSQDSGDKDRCGFVLDWGVNT